MRCERPHDRPFALALAGLTCVAASGLGAAAFGPRGAVGGVALGLLGGGVLLKRLSARTARRRQALSGPFPDAWRELLLESYDHYDRLPDEWRARFEDDLRLFLAEKRITGIGVAVSEELRLLAAASAVTLSLGWPEYDWDQLGEILLYRDDFDRDYSLEHKDLAGQAHPWGTVILSVPALRDSFSDPDDAYHVGLHEFAHLLDVDQSHFDGIPAGLDPRRHAEWLSLVEKEMERLRKGKSALDPYGADDPVEFLAVAVEAFFETPLLMRKRHREVYAILCEYFRQDPALWDDERGLVL